MGYSCCRTPQMKSWSWLPLHYAIYCWSSHPAKRYTLYTQPYILVTYVSWLYFCYFWICLCLCLSAAYPGVRCNWITMQSDPEWQSCTEGQWDLGPNGKKRGDYAFKNKKKICKNEENITETKQNYLPIE